MRKSILLAEYCRLKEIIEVLEKECPVCKASRKMKKRHIAKECPTYEGISKTPCHKNVQKRCNKIMDSSELLRDEIIDAIFQVHNELQIHFGMLFGEIQNHYTKWKESR